MKNQMLCLLIVLAAIAAYFFYTKNASSAIVPNLTPVSIPPTTTEETASVTELAALAEDTLGFWAGVI